MSQPRVPFHQPTRTGTELERLEEVLAGGKLGGDGSFTSRCQQLLERAVGSPKALLTTSCTHALEMAALLLDVGPGEEVVLPSFTFVSTANAFVLRGAKPVFADVRPDTLNLDDRQLPELWTKRTRAVVVVHYAGVAAEMSAIGSLCHDRGLALVEDNAHGLFGAYCGRPLGSFGCLSTCSFHETKNFTCGEGGALLINDAALSARAEILREKGTDRSRFFRGEVDKYTWVDVGSSYLPSELLAAFLLAQLEASESIQARRRRIWEGYLRDLAPWAKRHDVALPTVPEECDPAFHLFHLVLPTLEAREGLTAHLRERGIQATFHYLPLHLSAMGRRLGGTAGQCPVTESVCDRLLRLPYFTSLSEDERDRVVDAVTSFVP